MTPLEILERFAALEAEVRALNSRLQVVEAVAHEPIAQIEIHDRLEKLERLTPSPDSKNSLDTHCTGGAQ